MALHLVKPERKIKEELEHVPDSMNACLFYGPHDIRFENVPVPQINENEILIKVKAALTCGTNLKTYQRSHPILVRSIPSTFGHQFAGVVVEAEENIKDFYPAQRVVSLNSAPCFKCTYCIKEKFSLCENINFLNGAYAEYVAVPEAIVRHNTYQITKSTSFEFAAALEGLSVVVHGLECSEITSNKTVCIIGTGSIGLMFCALSKLNGAKVISIGRKDFKLDIAKKLGADHTLNLTNYSNPDELIKVIHDLSGGGPEIVIEAVGLPHLWELATRIVSKGGLVNFFGGCKKGTKVELDTYRLHYEEIKLIGVFHHTPKHVQIAFNLLINPGFQEKVLRNIITHSVLLKDLEKAFLMMESGEAIQVAVKP